MYFVRSVSAGKDDSGRRNLNLEFRKLKEKGRKLPVIKYVAFLLKIRASGYFQSPKIVTGIL